MKYTIIILLFAISCGEPEPVTGPISKNYTRVIELDKATQYNGNTFLCDSITSNFQKKII